MHRRTPPPPPQETRFVGETHVPSATGETSLGVTERVRARPLRAEAALAAVATRVPGGRAFSRVAPAAYVHALGLVYERLCTTSSPLSLDDPQVVEAAQPGPTCPSPNAPIQTTEVRGGACCAGLACHLCKLCCRVAHRASNIRCWMYRSQLPGARSCLHTRTTSPPSSPLPPCRRLTQGERIGHVSGGTNRTMDI